MDERFVLRVPANLDLAGGRAASLRRHHDLLAHAPLGRRAGQESRRGGVSADWAIWASSWRTRWARTWSCSRRRRVRRTTRSASARTRWCLSRDANEMQKHAGSFDFILDAVSADHDINAYIQLLRRDGNLTLVGAPEKPLAVAAFGLIMGRRSLSGSPIGGIPETQEMLDFCGAHNITADVEVIPIQKVNEAYERFAEGRREVPLLNRHGLVEGRVK